MPIKEVVVPINSVDVIVLKNEHANCDSLPFRYGVHFSRDAVIKIYIESNLGTDRNRSDRLHLEGWFSDPTALTESRHFGHFVIGKRNGFSDPVLVTVWREDAVTEFYLSETLKQLRTDGIVTPKDLLEMSPLYLSGEIRSSASLVLYLSKKMAQEDVRRLKDSEHKALQAVQEIGSQLEKTKLEKEKIHGVALEAISAVESLTEKSQQQEEEIRNLKAREEKRLREEREIARDQNSDAILSSPNILVKVEENVLYRSSNCTVITLSDNTSRYLKTATFDKSGAVTNRAHTLIGKRVRTTCWDPIDEPGKWSRQNYFRNIYELE